MGDDSAPLESSVVSPGNGFPLPDADSVAAAWPDTSLADLFLPRLDKAKTMSAAMLALGAALLLFVPLGGALLLVSGGLGLAISWEAPMGGLTPVPSTTRNATTATIQPQAPSSTNH